ncbi:unnamed protein product [Caenorhabditis nigoni]
MNTLLVLLIALIAFGFHVTADLKKEKNDDVVCFSKPPPERLPPYVAPSPSPSPPPHRSTRSSATPNISTFFSILLTFVFMNIFDS